ncbi:MAG: methyltransferase [Candidatus Nanoarchaeia archaeon]|nr:methyltransferase [Candidatus Nanoarchaeia archaeon]
MHKSIYEPSDDSYLLEKHVNKYAKGKVLEVGTGSGILAKAAFKKTKDVLAVDINPESVKHVKSLGIKAICSDLFANVEGKFDLIIFNPPYLPFERKEDRETALQVAGGKKGHEIIKKFLKQAKKHLEKNGKILLLFSSLSGDIEGIMAKEEYKFRKIDEKPLFFEKLLVYELR